MAARSFRQRLVDLAGEHEALQEAFADLQAECGDLRAHVASASELGKECRDLKASIADLQAECGELRARAVSTSELETECRDLRARIAGLPAAGPADGPTGRSLLGRGCLASPSLEADCSGLVAFAGMCLQGQRASPLRGRSRSRSPCGRGVPADDDEVIDLVTDDELQGEGEEEAGAIQAPHIASAAPAVKYEVAIPTHGRWRPVSDMSGKACFRDSTQPFILAHTLTFLDTQGIPKGLVTLFVADQMEAENYRRALQGSDWAGVRIVVSVLGNLNNRNFIFAYFKPWTYVVSIDDDVEGISWKFKEGDSQDSLETLPPGGLVRLIYDARERMRETGAHLWGLNVSQNPRNMRTLGLSVSNGLVNGYLNGFITRPHCRELLRKFADATEDSEFAVRHYAKDGVVLRYRMYAGVTRPFCNRGGLQQKFEIAGEGITADARKEEERNGAKELHKAVPAIDRAPPPPQGQEDNGGGVPPPSEEVKTP
eukprot:CAMPEP_0198544906 /NCGR_PEP_ID=MMETSP1462-20131121/62329_1 /TAXON_ID=1333877 /ORGANISM="Brandtodinium nutriculum, Strain RCC3387" /LENGTH=484 /DNA_ID=CAMNT_0044275267 /DNA_START=48 /DNA_END=1497 /DNA_ORIENTATION=-